jgi:hypothetical protein
VENVYVCMYVLYVCIICMYYLRFISSPLLPGSYAVHRFQSANELVAGILYCFVIYITMYVCMYVCMYLLFVCKLVVLLIYLYIRVYKYMYVCMVGLS